MQVWTLSTHTPINISKWLPWPGSHDESSMLPKPSWFGLNLFSSLILPLTGKYFLFCCIKWHSVFELLFLWQILPYVCVCMCVCVCACAHASAQSCLTICDPMDYSLPGSSLLGIIPARTLEWVAISFSRGSSWPRDRTHVSCIAQEFFYSWAIGEALVAKVFFFI